MQSKVAWQQNQAADRGNEPAGHASHPLPLPSGLELRIPATAADDDNGMTRQRPHQQAGPANQPRQPETTAACLQSAAPESIAARPPGPLAAQQQRQIWQMQRSLIQQQQRLQQQQQQQQQQQSMAASARWRPQPEEQQREGSRLHRDSSPSAVQSRASGAAKSQVSQRDEQFDMQEAQVAWDDPTAGSGKADDSQDVTQAWRAPDGPVSVSMGQRGPSSMHQVKPPLCCEVPQDHIVVKQGLRVPDVCRCTEQMHHALDSYLQRSCHCLVTSCCPGHSLLLPGKAVRHMGCAICSHRLVSMLCDIKITSRGRHRRLPAHSALASPPQLSLTNSG